MSQHYANKFNRNFNNVQQTYDTSQFLSNFACDFNE